MSESIIVAIITGVLTLAGVLIANSRSDAIQNERIDQLRQEVKKHNNLIDRMYKCEESVALHEAELKRVNRRLEVVEKKEAK